MGEDSIYIPTVDRFVWYLLGIGTVWFAWRVSEAAAQETDAIPLLISAVVP